MPIDLEDLHDIAVAVWDSLDSELELDEAGDSAPGIDQAGSVAIQGCWEGEVVLETAEATLRSMAARMFGIEETELDVGHMEDTMKELTNMVGGNVKCLLGDDVRLSLPEVRSGFEAGASAVQMFFRDDAGGVRISLVPRSVP
jgi:chemotaxis protein CheX